MQFKSPLFLAALSLMLALPSAGQASSNLLWDGTWSGVFNQNEPVSVTISGGKVVGYTIRGLSPYPVEFSRVTFNTVSFGDHGNYSVTIRKRGGGKAVGVAHSPIGNGSAFLTKQ